MAVVVSGLASLGLAGLGIDYLRWEVTRSGPVPRFPLGIAPSETTSPMLVLAAIAAAVLLAALITALLKWFAALASAGLSQRVLWRLRCDVYDKLQRLSFRFYDAAESSSLINRAAGDVQAVRTFVDGVIVKLLVVTVSLAAYVAYMLSVHVSLTVACLAASPLLWWGAVTFSRRTQPAYRQSSELHDRLIRTLVENVQGMQVVKGFARQQQQIERFRAANLALRDQKRRIFWRLSLYQPAMGLLTQVNMLVLLGYGGWLVIEGRMPLGAGMFVFANLLHEFANQVGQITNIANTVQTSLTGAGRVFEVLDAPLEIASPPGARRLPRAQGAVRMENVSFSYRRGQPTLRELNFSLTPGQRLGIVGETGAGKTTLLSLLGRFYDVDAGVVRIDGIDVRQLDIDDLRRSIGMVFQESFLFSSTIADNIAFGRPRASLAQVEQAARIACAHDFISSLPEGYDSLIGEHGCNLSGGQRQRLAIARAVLLDPPILVFDDATAAIDPQTEHEIEVAMQSAMQGRTTILVSNRIRSLRQTDLVIVLDSGRIVQQGSLEELLARPGRLRRIAQLQCEDAAPHISRPLATPMARYRKEAG